MNLLGKATNPEFWSNTVRNSPEYRPYLEERLKNWNDYCEGKVITDLKYSDFKRFFVDGNRNIYETQYFRRRQMLVASSVLAMVYPEEEKYLSYLQDIIFAVCDEYTWCLPAHHPKLEENNNVFIDLFAAETGFALAEIYTMLGERLDKVIAERIKHEINYRIISSFSNNLTFWWERRCTNNWAAVCGGSVGCTFMLMRPDLFETLKPRFDLIMENYLSGIHDDGYCLEGTGYWHYGFGFFTVYADMVKTFTDGEVDYFARPKVRTISTFIQKMFLSERASVSFADGDINLSYQIGLTHYLKSIYPDDVKVYSAKYSYTNDDCARYCLAIRSATWFDPEVYNNPEDNVCAEYYGKDSQWVVRRASDFGFAAKAGNNNEHHNHNDVGTFIFAKGGKQLISDIGRGLYCKQYFRDATRYDFIETSSLGHSVPFFGTLIQKTGKQYAAKDTYYAEGCFRADIAGAYADESLKSLVREFKMTNECITLTDTFDYCGEAPITERFVSLIEPTVENGRAIIGGAELITDASPTVSSTVGSKNQTVWFVDYVLDKNTKSFTLTVK